MRTRTDTSVVGAGPKHTRYTILATLDVRCVLRAAPMEDKPSGNRDFTRDSIAVTVVCYRPGKERGEIEFLAFLYNNGIRGLTFRFPTETGEQDLNETPELVARACLYQEVIVSDGGHPPSVGLQVLENVKPSDSSVRLGSQTSEILGVPTWFEASELMDKMRSRGIRSHRASLFAAIRWLAMEKSDVAERYMRNLAEWEASL